MSAPYGKASEASSEQRAPQYSTNQSYGQQAPYAQQAYSQQAYPQQAYLQQYGYPVAGQSVTVVAQLPPPPTYLAWSIISLLFFCLPLGIAALIMSLGVSNDCAVGQHVEARRKSSIARTLNIVATVLGVVIYIIIGVWVGVKSSQVYVYG